MPVENTLDWSEAGPNGSYAVGSDGIGNEITVTSSSANDGNSASVETNGTPAREALWVSSVDEPITTTIAFDTPVTNVSFELFDVDQASGSWDDSVTIIAYDAEGNMVEISYGDLDGLHTVTDGTVDADGNASVGVETSGADDSVTVSIAGPITSIEIIFDNGESASNTGIIGVSDITFNNAPDGIVEGSAAPDMIDGTYVEDPEGDLVTTGADSIDAGDGNDTVYAYEGNDTILGGDGNDLIYSGEDDDYVEGGLGADTVEMDSGNDTFIGGEGDDSANGDYGNDILIGGTGDDWMRGSYGNDTLYSGGEGEGDDFLWGGYGDDVFIMEDGFGNDTIEGENQDETHGDTVDLSAVTRDITHDLTEALSENGSFTDGEGTTTYEAIEHIVLSGGTDTLVLADYGGDDIVTGFTLPTDNGDGTFSSGDMLDVSGLTSDWGTTPIHSGDISVSEDDDGNAVLNFPGGESLTLVGISPEQVDSPDILEAMGVPEGPDGYVSGTDGDDAISLGYEDQDGDEIDSGDARLAGTTGDDDHIIAGDGADHVSAWHGNDSVEGGQGADTLFGSTGNDTLAGGSEDDELYGEDGDDVLDGGAGADDMYGGDDRDIFLNVTAGDEIYGGSGGDDFDTIDLTGAGPTNIIRDPDNSENGTIEFLDSDGNVTGTATFKDIEHILPCFTPGTMIATIEGLKAVEDIKVGDQVFTRDHGAQEVRWAGQKLLTKDLLAKDRYLSPILIRKGALGENLPDRDMMLSPNHRVLVNSPELAVIFGESEVLASAKHLVGRKGVERLMDTEVTYVHFMFDRHEIVWSDGLWSESFQPGSMAMAGLDEAQRNEIYTLFPELKDMPESQFPAARRVLRRHEAELLARI